MPSYLLTWNPTKWKWDDIEDAIREVIDTGEYADTWSVGTNNSIQPGDRVFLIRLGLDPKGIFADGYADSKVYEDEHWDEEKKANGQTARYIRVKFKNILDAEKNQILKLTDLQDGVLGNMHWSSRSSGVTIQEDVATELEERWNKVVLANNIASLSIDEKIAIVCLYFARLESDDPLYKGEYSKVLGKVAEKYNVKYSSQKNNKDRFDANFENGRKGWHQLPLERQHKFLYSIYLKYKDMPIEDIQALVHGIISEIDQEGHPFYSIKTKNPKQVESILRKEANIEIDGLNILKDNLKAGQLVFIVLGGDKGQSWVTWETGLIGMGIISAEPYDIGYEGRNYKIKIDVKVLLDKPIKRDDLKPYSDTYDIIGIGPITKWEPNQAISQIPEKKAVALMRAMLELCPGCDDDLTSVIDEKLVARVKGAVIKLVPQEVDYGEELPVDQDEQDDNESDPADDFAENYQPDIETILEDFTMSKTPIITLKNFINSNKHIIMTGPPGTGKTTLAERACQEAVDKEFISNYMMTTAVSDWSTFDTIGGYMPDRDGKLIFQEGMFLKSIRENKWIIIDEINRAEIDKAFGHFFTVLSGKDVELQYRTDTPFGEKNITIKHVDTKGSYYDSKTASYCIGRNWRIISTMNTYDKNSLFMLSYALMRRFAFVYIPAPSEDDFASLASSRLSGQDDVIRLLLQITKASPKKIGAAILLDLITYIKSAGVDNMVEGICSLVIPQYEGISLPQIKQLYKDLGCLFKEEDRMTLMNYLCEFFDVNTHELSKISFTEAGNDDNEENLDDDM